MLLNYSQLSTETTLLTILDVSNVCSLMLTSCFVYIFGNSITQEVG
jgi:hypothetical protein